MHGPMQELEARLHEFEPRTRTRGVWFWPGALTSLFLVICKMGLDYPQST